MFPFKFKIMQVLSKGKEYGCFCTGQFLQNKKGKKD
jgi:hypothetical protein